MKFIQNFLPVYLAVSLFAIDGQTQEQIGVASAVNKNTTDLTLEQERKLIDAGYEIIQNHTIETDGIGRAQMLLLDGTAFSIGPNSSVVLDKFIYNPETAEGSLEVTARGLLRIVGGKVTKKQPALIRTNSATVGIRGGIGIVQTNGSQTNATFLYGTEMTVTPNCVDLDSFGDQCSPDFATTVTEPGFSVSVESEDSEPSEPVAVTEESLDALQEELEAPEEVPEEESAAEETPAEESPAEETQEEEAAAEETPAEESPAEETQEEEAAPNEETSSEETAADEMPADETALESTETESEASAEVEVEAKVASDEVGDSTDIEVDEGLLDSSGVSDVSSDVEPEELGTAEEFEIAIELETVEADDANEDSTESTTEEVTETTQETTVEVAPIFEVEALEVVESVDENTSEINLAQFAVVNTGEQNYTVTIEGEGSEAFAYNQETNSLEVIEELDHESQESVELTVTFTSDNGDVQEVTLALNVADVDEVVELVVEPVNTISEAAISGELIANQVNVSETVPAGTVIATFSATDPEGNALTYSLSGSGSELMTVSETGEVSLIGGLDFEANSTLVVMLEVSDGVNATTEEITINVINDDEPASIAAILSASSFAENAAVGVDIASVNASDPEGGAVTFTLSGAGSDNFTIDASGNITLASGLDYETATSYELTVVADDGTYASTKVITISVADVNEAPTLSSTVAFNAFLENTATGTTIATSSSTDPEAGAISYSLSGTGSENFSVSSDGTVTLASGLDYETATGYAITLTASDGANSVSETLTINVGDINEAPSLTNSLAASSFAENVSTGTTIATTSASDPESQTITYSLSGTGSEKFTVDSAGNITLSSALDYETTTSYSLTLTASDGANSTSNTINISVDDVIELSIALASSSISLSEAATSGTSVTTTATTTDGSATVTYSLSGTDSDKFTVSSNGTITTAASLDYETTTSYSLTLTATDGTNTVTDNLTINITDVDLSLSASLASAAQSEGLSTGTTIATSSNSNAEGTVSYSITDSDNKFSINSSTGEVTLANALDYETKTSHTFTVTATDGVTTVTEEFTLSVTDMIINTLAVSLANSGAALAESSSSGTSVGSSSISNPDSETVSYSLSGTGSSNFAVDSSGNVTTNATLDFETAKSYSLTLTATAGGNTTTDAFTVNVGNVEELESAVLRYSADYNSASRSGFSATATRGPSGSSLAAYTLEQVGTTNSTAITSVDDTSNNYVPVEINSGTALNWRYYFPVDTAGNGQFAFAPNSSALDGKYYSPLGTAVTTTIANADFLTAGRLEGAEYWFMTTDKAAANISYQSSNGQRTYGVIGGSNAKYSTHGSLGASGNTWQTAITGAGYTFQSCYNVNLSTCLSDASIDINDVGIIVVNSLGTYTFGYSNSDLADWIDGGGNFFQTMWEHSGGCCGSTENMAQAQGIFSALGWSGLSGVSSGASETNVTITQSTIDGITNNGGTLDYSDILNAVFNPATSGYMNIPSVCNSFGNNDLFICDPGRTGSTGAVMGVGDVNAFSNYILNDNWSIMQWFAGLNTGGSATTSTYNLYEDQVTLAGEVYKDANFVSFTDSNKRVIAMAVIPIENFAASGSSNDYFIPNFVPKTLWSYGDVGHDYCLGAGNNASACNTYDNYYDFSSIALDSSDMLDTSRFNGSTNELPEGQSMWWQVLNPSGVGVGLWAQISLKDSYDGASGSTLRDDQQSLLNVVISNVDYRKNDTTRYSAGDTGLGMDGYHYWSYQGATNADNDGLGINYGTSPIECATSNDSGCFWGDSSNQPGGAMITSSDPYKSGSMTLGVNYNSNNDTFSTGSFNVSAVVQDVKPSSSSYADYASLSDFRSSDFYSSSATGYSGFFSGILEFDVSGTGNSQLSSIRSSSTLATFTFDTTNDDLQVVAPMTISAAPSNNYTSNWSTVDTGSMTLKFGDATNDEAKSAYISSEVFAAEIQDDGAQIDGTSGGSNNLAGVMVSYNTLDKEDTDLFHTGGNDSMPDTAYSTWGFWAMSAADVSPNSGTQNASVHLGTWVGGEVVDQNEIPTSGSASMSGAAVMSVAYRYNQTGTNYDVHKYTTTADVAATFNWGGSGYSGTLAFTNFDDKNPIVDNAGFASFSVAITGTDNTYTGNSTDSLANSWLGGASVAGALYGDSSPDESGGRVNVNLYKSGDTSTAGANDFYFAEGIYLVD
ncbi:cadherin domain-containing protein [Pseudomonadota bacterium]|nr:cadherin domain-containing protein [Pseudomonadota bacterium]